MNPFKLKFNFLFILSLFIFMISCESDDSTIDNENIDNKFLQGYWLLTNGETYAIKDNGEKIVTAKLKPGVVAHEFLADGTYIGHDLVGSTPNEKGTWKLIVTKKEGNEIEEGVLSITTPSTLANKGMLFTDEDGSMKFSITSTYSKVTNKKSAIYLETKKYEAYPYAENWGLYIYEKQ